ncbi:threonine/serine exporter family protein [bacterium]|nr:threonine/serine exporter family protein [bacterium]
MSWPSVPFSALTFGDGLDLILLILGVIAGIGASAVTFRIPPKELFWATAAGFMGWEVMYCLEFYDINTLTATTLGALATSLCSEFMARDRRVPASIYVVPGILPLVPGRAIYNAMFSIINGQHDLSKSGAMQAILGAGGIAIGLLIGTAIARGVVHPQHRLRAAIEREQHRHLHSQQQLVSEQHQAAHKKAQTEREAKAQGQERAGQNTHRGLHSGQRHSSRTGSPPASAASDRASAKEKTPEASAHKRHAQITAKRSRYQSRAARYEKRRRR